MISRIIGVRHSIPEDAAGGLRLILEPGYEKAKTLGLILAMQLLGQKALVLCSPRLEAYMTALIIAMCCDELTIVTHPDLLDPSSCKPRGDAPDFITDEAERHEASVVIIVHHAGQVEQLCTNVARELGHEVNYSWEVGEFLERELNYAEAVVLDLEKSGLKVSYLN
ncbi:MAG: hypothetical protein IT410_03540 [Candidatus Doudnabacteria bacterium]|nr:hypothetical protein [Candidatus Doudnabacteria bacterium]